MEVADFGANAQKKEWQAITTDLPFHFLTPLFALSD
jgi:hypothetical protein